MSYVGHLEFFAIIDMRDCGLSLCDNMVVHNVVGEQTVF